MSRPFAELTTVPVPLGGTTVPVTVSVNPLSSDPDTAMVTVYASIYDHALATWLVEAIRLKERGPWAPQWIHGGLYVTTVDVLPSGALYAVELNGRHMTIPDPMGRADRTMTVAYLQLRCEVLSAQRLNGDPAGELLAHIAGWNHD